RRAGPVTFHPGPAQTKKGHRPYDRCPCPASRANGERLLRRDDEVAAPVARPAALRLLGALRRLLALADHDEAVGGDAEADEILLHRVGASFAERQVVLVGAAR